jgi:predicted GNAT family acetyltransferase
VDQTVRRNDERHRYELIVDDRVAGIADFSQDGTTFVLPHTEIDPQLRGQGLGAVLVKGVLDDVRAQGGVVVPACWYVREYLDQHPEDADLLSK